MADTTLAILSERELSMVTLRTPTSFGQNIDGDQRNNMALPTGFGDLYLHRVSVYVTGIATMVASPEILGLMFWLSTADGNESDVMGFSRWQVIRAGELGSWFDLIEEPALWRESERLSVDFGEVDTNAAPTADLRVYAYVTRRRNIGAQVRPGRPRTILTS